MRGGQPLSPSFACTASKLIAWCLTWVHKITYAAASGPPAAQLRTALYQHAFNPARTATSDEATARVLAWAEQASLPLARLADPVVFRRALEALTLRLDGSRSAANTITRKRAVFHGALGYAVEAGLLESNPADRISWQVPKAATAIDPKVVASPAQAEALLAAVARIRPDLMAFFGCLYYGALPPEEAVALRLADCYLPARGWGMLTLTRAVPRTAKAWSGTGSSYERRGLKHQSEGTVRIVPIPSVLVAMLRHHYRCYGTAPDGRLFRGARGGPLSESSYGRTWHSARSQALGSAATATSLARRPYDLRHAALSLWLNAGAAPRPDRATGRAQHHRAARRLHPLHRRPGRHHQPADRTSPQRQEPGTSPDIKRFCEPPVRPDPVRHMSVDGPHSGARAAACQPPCTRSQASRLRSPTVLQGVPRHGHKPTVTWANDYPAPCDLRAQPLLNQTSPGQAVSVSSRRPAMVSPDWHDLASRGHTASYKVVDGKPVMS